MRSDRRPSKDLPHAHCLRPQEFYDKTERAGLFNFFLERNHVDRKIVCVV